MNRLALAFLVAVLAAPLPVVAQIQLPPTPQTKVQDERDLRASILLGCNLKAWQLAVRITPGGLPVQSLSPTVLAWQKQCVSKMINNYIADNN